MSTDPGHEPVGAVGAGGAGGAAGTGAAGSAGAARGAPDEADELDGLGYGAALAELERILAELEGEAVDLDHLAERVRRAAVLIRWCRSRIAATKLEIETVVADLERLADDG